MESRNFFYRRPILFSLLFYTAGAVALFYLRFLDFVIDPDKTSYVSLARLIARGHFQESVTAYWAPLSSWLLAPILAAGLEPLRALSLASLLMGFVTLFAFARLAASLELEPRLRFAIFVCAAAPIWLMKSRFADLTFVTVLLFYLSAVRPARWTLPQALLCGALGGLAYLSKSYGLPFFLLHFSVFGWIGLRERKLKPQHLAITFAAWALICGAWVAEVRMVTGRLTLGEASSFTWNALNPECQTGGGFLPGFCSLPLATNGLSDPGPGGLSAWETPIIVSGPFRGWSPLASVRHLRYFGLNVAKCFYDIYANLKNFFDFYLAFLLAALCVLFFGTRKERSTDPILFFTATILLFPLGYALLVVEDRYLWLDWLLILPLSALLLEKLFGRLGDVRAQRLLVLAVYGLFLFTPVKEILRLRNSQRSYAVAAARIEGCSKIENVAANDNYFEGTYFSLYWNAHYHGSFRSAEPAPAMEQQLKDRHVDHFLLWNPDQEKVRFPFLAKYRETKIEDTRDFPAPLSIFDLNAYAVAVPCAG